MLTGQATASAASQPDRADAAPDPRGTLAPAGLGSIPVEGAGASKGWLAAREQKGLSRLDVGADVPGGGAA